MCAGTKSLQVTMIEKMMRKRERSLRVTSLRKRMRRTMMMKMS